MAGAKNAAYKLIQTAQLGGSIATPPPALRAAAFSAHLKWLNASGWQYAVWCWIVHTGAPEISERNRASVAQKIQILFIDDLDGTAAEGTVRFGLDGTEYEIDLNAKHAKELRDALTRYVGAARRASGAARRPARTGRRASANGLNTTEVREWAKAQGIEVKDRGRVPAELVVKFKAATGQ